VKAAAPPAPVSSSVKSAKNRKVPGHGRPAALGRGPAKGSVLFQQLMSARAAGKNDLARLAAAAQGLKAAPSAAVALKIPRQAAPQGHPHGDVPVIVSAAALTDKDKPDAERKAARSKATGQHIVDAHLAVHPDSHAMQHVPFKEKKPDTNELSKAPVAEAKAPASHALPVVRVLDLRHGEKVRVSTEATDARKVEGAASSGKDPAAALTVRVGPTADTFTEALPKAAPVAQAPAQTPLEHLREMAGSELVRASTLVLKDGGGEIRLVLKPESLGSVRIRMNVVDNAIEGRIIVDSAAVKHVFDGSVDALRRALTAEGFQMGSLQVSVGGQNTDSGERRRQDETPAVRKIAAQGFERNVPGTEDVSLGDLFVNLFV